MLLLDGVFLLLFIVPGLAAFGVDFYTGAIYLPDKDGNVALIQLDPDDLDFATIERAIELHTGQPVDLQAPEVEVRYFDRRV